MPFDANPVEIPVVHSDEWNLMEKGISKISDIRNWCQGTGRLQLAINTKYCAVGSIFYSIECAKQNETYQKIEQALNLYAKLHGYGMFVHFNDEHTHAQVIAAMREVQKEFA